MENTGTNVPRISNILKHPVRLQVVVTAAQERAIYRAAERARKSVSAFLRELIDEHLQIEQIEQIEQTEQKQAQHEQERIEA